MPGNFIFLYFLKQSVFSQPEYASISQLRRRNSLNAFQITPVKQARNCPTFHKPWKHNSSTVPIKHALYFFDFPLVFASSLSSSLVFRIGSVPPNVFGVPDINENK